MFPPLWDPLEVDDESYFGGRRKGKRGPGVAGKVVVFGILQHGGRAYHTNHSRCKAENPLADYRSEDCAS